MAAPLVRVRFRVRAGHLDSAEHANCDKAQHVLRPEHHLRAKQRDGRAETRPPPRPASTAAVVVPWSSRADMPVVSVGRVVGRHRLRQWDRRWVSGQAVGVKPPFRASTPAMRACTGRPAWRVCGSGLGAARAMCQKRTSPASRQTPGSDPLIASLPSRWLDAAADGALAPAQGHILQRR
jgi:hypothetical protein